MKEDIEGEDEVKKEESAKVKVEEEEEGVKVTSIEEIGTPRAYAETNGGPVQAALSVRDQTDIEIRLQLLERQFQDVRSADASRFSTAASSVIVSLRWAFLMSLEKPLRKEICQDLPITG